MTRGLTGSRASRRGRRHLMLAGGTAAIMAAVWVTIPTGDVIGRLSMGSAYAAMTWLSWALILGPLNVLRGRPNPVSFDLRRDVGIWAGAVGVFHVLVGLNTHYRGRMWLYFLEHWPDRTAILPLRMDVFGLANYVGLGATFILVMLLVLSNDASLRRLGPTRWKRLQRWSYAAFALVVLHGAGYQFASRRALPFVVLFGAMVLPVLLLQGAGQRRVKAGHRGRSEAPSTRVPETPDGPGND